MKLVLPTVLLGSVAALPLLFNESVICQNGACDSPNAAYEQILDIQPGYQWNDAGGYCGSWSIQRAALGKGAWISQQKVRDATSDGGGHDHEILSTNIEEAYRNLKISVEGFDFVNEPVPQQDAYAKWLKKQIVAGYPVTWMIMWNGQSYPIYGLTPPAGLYGHIEPVVGIQSNHPLDDETVYDDDVIVHYTDGGTNTVHRTFSSLGGEWAGPGHQANCRPYSYCMATYAFGWAVKDFVDDAKSLPASLKVEPHLQEPDTRSGEKPTALQGTLTVKELTEGSSYDIYRWDTVEDAFTYSDNFKKTTFKATSDTFVYSDDQSFQSDSATYYRCVPQAAGLSVLV
jgi:hypothetical protein